MRKTLQPLKTVSLFTVGGILGFLLFIVGVLFTFRNRMFPGVSIAQTYVGGMTRQEAKETLVKATEGFGVRLRYGEMTWEIPGESLDIDLDKTVERAYGVGRRWEQKEELINLAAGKLTIPLVYDEDLKKIASLAGEIEGAVFLEAVPPSLEVEGKEVVIREGKDGTRVDREKFMKMLRQHIAYLESGEVEIPTITTNHVISEEKKREIQERAKLLLATSLPIAVDEQKLVLQGKELVGFLAVTEGGVLEEAAVKRYIEGLAESINREPVNARFQFAEGRVTEFVPDKPGLMVQVDESVGKITEALIRVMKGEKVEAAVLAVTTTQAKVKTGDVNNIGIEERIGHGESFFKGSIASRIHNLTLTAARIHGVIIPPGGEFSFNDTVGEISAATGYQTAYVIQNGRTVLGDGGGVCQDSTTLFRAVLNAGLPITERWAHSYRVGYYEQNTKPGFDATVFSPSKDFRFINDTGNNILIEARVDNQASRLTVDLYGKADGRKSYVSTARVWDVTPPPPDLYQDDPTLPAGTVKQVDWKAWGAKAAFDYRVEKDGQVTFAKTYSSVYRPWQNVFLKGTKTE